MTEITAKLAARKLNDATGLSDADAAEFWNVKGSKRVAIVELEHLERSENTPNDTRTVRLRVTHLELAPDGKVSDYLRELSAAIYKQRQPAPLDPEFGAETLDQVVGRGATVLEPEPAGA